MRWKRDLQRVEDLEVQAVNAAEKGTLEDTFELLHSAFAEAPNHASPSDNRAQVSTLGTRPFTLGGRVWACTYIQVVPRTEC